MKKVTVFVAGAVSLLTLYGNSASCAEENIVDNQTVPRSEYEKMKGEVEVLKAQMQLLLEKGAGEQQAQRQSKEAVAAAAKQPETQQAGVVAEAESPPPAQKSAPAEKEMGLKEGDRKKEAEEAKKGLDEFLRTRKVIVKPGDLQFEFNTAYAKDTAENTCFTPPLGSNVPFCAEGARATPKLISQSVSTGLFMRYGLANDVEFNLSVPFVFVEQEANFTPFVAERNIIREDNSGLGDINGGLRWSAWHEEGFIPETTLNLNVKSDTGSPNRALGTGHWNVGAGVSLVKTIDPVVFFGSLGYTATLESTFRGRRIDPGDQIPYSLGMGFSLNDRVSFSTSLSGAAILRTEVDGQEFVGSSAGINTLSFAVTVQVTKQLFLEPFVGLGLTDESNDFFVGISIPYRLEDRYKLPFFHD